jgi:pyruvate/2-oxoglutarate dehydrogenase complex dihydrolipoamide dehydrogenase (E3) component
MMEHHPESAIILGSGYIGMEMADALTRKGLSVTVLKTNRS